MHSNLLDCVLRVLQGIVTVVLPLLTLLVTMVLAAITYWYAQHTKDMAQSTAKQVETARKTAQGDMLLRLNELYADKRTTDAIRFIYAFKEADDKKEPSAAGKSRYSLGQAYYRQHATGTEGDLHRWHLTNFWYTVVMLQEQGVIDDALIQRRFGSSLDVIDLLERVEAVRSYRLWEGDEASARQTWKKPEWPIWNLYARYKGQPQQATIPADEPAFKRWTAEAGPRAGESV